MDRDSGIPRSDSVSGVTSPEDSTQPTTVEESRRGSLGKEQIEDVVSTLAIASAPVDADQLAEKLDAVVKVTDVDTTTSSEVPAVDDDDDDDAIPALEDPITETAVKDAEKPAADLEPEPTSGKSVRELEKTITELQKTIFELQLKIPAKPAIKLPLPIPGAEEGHPLPPLSRTYDPTKDDGFTIEELLARPRLPRSPYERLTMERAKARKTMSAAEIAEMDAAEDAARAQLMIIQKERDDELRIQRHAELREFGRKFNAEYKGPWKQ